MLLTGGDNEILGNIMLEHQPHTFNIIFGITPVTQRIKISQFQIILQPAGDTADSQGYLACYKIFATAF